MLAMPHVWWLRPVSSAARVGEQSAVVLNWLYLSPLLATRSKFGVGIGPPNVLAAPKPVSSVMMSRTLGAPLGAVTSLGKSGLDSLALRPTTPPNGASRTGRTGEPPVGNPGLVAFWPKAISATRRVPNSILWFIVLLVCLGSCPRWILFVRLLKRFNPSS